MEVTSGGQGCGDVVGGDLLSLLRILRVGEFTCPIVNSFDGNIHLSPADISVDCSSAPSMLFVRLKQSKTDQLRQGVTIVLG